MNQSLIEQLTDAVEELGRARVRVRRLENDLRTEKRLSAEYRRELDAIERAPHVPRCDESPVPVCDAVPVLYRWNVPVMILATFAGVLAGALMGR